MAGPWEDYAKPAEQQSEGPWNDYKAEAEPTEEKLKTEGTFDEHIDAISKKYKVTPSALKGFARDLGSTEAAEGVLAPAQKLMSGVAAAGEAITMGIPTKLAKKALGVVKGPDYEKALDEVQDLVEQRKSLQAKAFEFGVGMMVPGGAVAKAETLLGKVAAGSATGAVTGGLAGFGASKAGEEVSGTATGGAVGGVLGLAAPLAGAGIKKGSEAVKEAGEEALTKMFGLGRTQKQREELLKAGTTAREETMKAIKNIGGIQPTDKKFVDILDRIAATKEATGEVIGQSLKEADKLKKEYDSLLQKEFISRFGKSTDVEGKIVKQAEAVPSSFFSNANMDLSNQLGKIASELGDTPAERSLAKKLMSESKRYFKKADKTDMSIEELQRMKVALDSQINYEAKKNLDNNFTKKMRDAVSAAIDKRIDDIDKVDTFVQARMKNMTLDPEFKILENLRSARSDYGYYSKILKAAEKAEAARMKAPTQALGATEGGWSTAAGLLTGFMYADPVTGILTKMAGNYLENVYKKVQAGEISPAVAKKMIDYGAKGIKNGELAQDVIQRFMREAQKEGMD